MINYISILILISIGLGAILFIYIFFKFLYRKFAISRTKIYGLPLPVFYLPPRRNVPIEVFDNNKYTLSKREKRKFNIRATIKQVRESVLNKSFKPIIRDPTEELNNTIEIKVRKKNNNESFIEEPSKKNLISISLDELEKGQIKKQAQIIQKELGIESNENLDDLNLGEKNMSNKYSINLNDQNSNIPTSGKNSPLVPQSEKKINSKTKIRSSFIQFFLTPSFFLKERNKSTEEIENEINKQTERENEKEKQRRRLSYRRKKKKKTIRNNFKSFSNIDDEYDEFEEEEYDDEINNNNLNVFNFNNNILINRLNIIEKLKQKRIDNESFEKNTKINSGPLPEEVPDGYKPIYVPQFTDEYIIYKRILYKFNTKSTKGWYLGTVVARSKKENCNYKIKYDRAETKTVFVDGVRNVKIELSGDQGYGKKWILVEPISQNNSVIIMKKSSEEERPI